jgi:phosphoribosylaminoimidazole-succinocarboxamide synthase
VTAPLFESSIKSLPLISKGKVRDIYAIDADKLQIITTDRLSAFDVILPDPIPRKGEVLQAVANFWFEKLGHVVSQPVDRIDPKRSSPTTNATRCAAGPSSSSA